MSEKHEDLEALNHLFRATLKRKELARDEFDHEDIDACELVSRALERAIAAIEREAALREALESARRVILQGNVPYRDETLSEIGAALSRTGDES